MKVTGEALKAAAVDARLSFSDEEEESLKRSIQQVVEHIEDLKERIASLDVLPLFYPLEIKNMYREDRQEKPLPREKALANGPDTDSSCFHVPRIIEG